MKLYFKTLPPKVWAKDMDRLPQETQNALRPLFSEYSRQLKDAGDIDKTELEIVKVLDKAKIYKIKLDDGLVYRMKRLKSGGPGKGERLVLRRDKA